MVDILQAVQTLSLVCSRKQRAHSEQLSKSRQVYANLGQGEGGDTKDSDFILEVGMQETMEQVVWGH
jgi:hypothetical protein